MAEIVVDPGKNPLGNRMFQRLGLPIDLRPIHFQDLHQKGLHQPVLAHHDQGGLPALGGQPHALAGTVFQETLGRQ